jgi:hypothetical protein
MNWADQIWQIVDFIVKTAGAFMAIGFTLNGAHIIIHSGVSGGSKAISDVIMRAIGMIAGFLLVLLSRQITAEFYSAFMKPIF